MNRVLTGERRPPMACRNTNWQLSADESELPSYELLRWFIRFEIALLAASAESSAISLLGTPERPHPCGRVARILRAILISI